MTNTISTNKLAKNAIHARVRSCDATPGFVLDDTLSTRLTIVLPFSSVWTVFPICTCSRTNEELTAKHIERLANPKKYFISKCFDE